MSEKIRMFVAQAVRESGLTQKDAATSARMTESQLNMYLNGKSELRTDTLHRLLLALGKDLKMIKKQLKK